MYMSGYAGTPLRVEEEGQILSKPFRTEVLTESVERVLAGPT
jgi:hypothetical protein